ncbi:MAG: elongation factor Ts [Chloroflexota bacterium]
MEIPIEKIKELRERCGAGIMDCRKALTEAGGDIDQALESLKCKGAQIAQKVVERETAEGLVDAYIHTGGRVGAMVEVNCETDFVARTDEFKHLAHELAMQVAAVAPKFVSQEDIPSGTEADPTCDCLLLQPYIRDPSRTIKDIITEVIARVGENIRVKRFARFELGT